MSLRLLIAIALWISYCWAGQTVTHSFTADKTCTCEIEWEDTSTQLGTLTVSP